MSNDDSWSQGPKPVTEPSITTREGPAFLPAAGKDLAFVDVETSGQNPLIHEVVQCAVVRYDPRTREVVSETQGNLRMRHPGQAEAKALAVNGYDEGIWQFEASPRLFWLHIGEMIDDAVLVGHNVAFDKQFIATAMGEYGVKTVVGRHSVCTMSLMWPLVASGKIRSMSLRAACDYFAIPRRDPHDARVDAWCAFAVYCKLIEMHGFEGPKVDPVEALRAMV